MVKGYCRTVFESTIKVKQEFLSEKKFSTSKVLYGEKGVLLRDLQSVNPKFVVKHVKKNLQPFVRKIKKPVVLNRPPRPPAIKDISPKATN